MVAIEWKMFGGKGLESWYLGWLAFFRQGEDEDDDAEECILGRRICPWQGASSLLEGNVAGDKNRTGPHLQ
jgi:hypothetical protein